MRILILTNVVPYPLQGGVQLRVFHLATRLARRHHITVGCHSWGEADSANAALLSQRYFPTICGAVYPFQRRHIVPSLSAALHGIPPETAQYQSPVLHQLVRDGKFDIVQVEETLLAPYANSIPAGSPGKTVLTFHNIHFSQTRRIAAIEPSTPVKLLRYANAAWMRRYEPRLARQFHRVITVTPDDQRLLAGAAPGVRIDVLPNGVDTEQLQPLPVPGAPPAILFVGSMNYRPCMDAACWLVRDILPLLRRAIPALELWLVGRSPSTEVKALAGNGVHVTGTVDDTIPYYARSAVAVVPLRAGGGSRLKILEAMALGRPVVSTTVGAEGIAAREGESILLADTPDAFASAVVRLFHAPALARSLASSARRHVESHHGWDGIAARQLEIYREVAGDV